MSFLNLFRKAKSGLNSGLAFRRFELESLEDRCLLSVNPVFAGDASALAADNPAATGDEDVLIQIGDTIAGLTEDTDATVSLAEGHTIDNVTVQIDAYFTNGYKNTLNLDNAGTIGVFDFQTSSSVYQMLQTAWVAVMGNTPIPTQQELYYYYYDGETAASNPFNTGSDENITTFLNALQNGNARYKALANQIIVRMKGMHDVADVTTLNAVNSETATIGEGLDKLWGFGGGVSFENYGTISCDIDSTDGQGADIFVNDGGTMGGFASGSTGDAFSTGGGAVNGDVNVGAGDDVVIVFDTTAFGGEITFGDGDDTLVLYGSALGDAGTVFSAGLADVPEQIVIYDVAIQGAAETTVTVDTAIPDTDVTVDFSLVDAAAYGEYGVAIGAEGDLSAVGAYSVLLDADTVLGNGDDKVVIFSGATANNFNLDAEFAFRAGESSAVLTIDGADKLAIGGYEYSLLYDGADVYLKRAAAGGKADLTAVSVTAVDKYTGETLDIDGGVLTPSNVANVTVTFANVGDGAVADAYFYSAVRLKNADTGEYITLNPGKDWYERYCAGGQDAGETGSFSFLLPRLAAGNYTIEVQLNNRGTVDESNYDNDYSEVNFHVGGSDLVVTVDSFSAVDAFTGEVLDIVDGGIQNTNNARVTVTFWNIGEQDVDVAWPSGNTYFYNEVRVYDEDGNYYVMDATGRWYERIVVPGYVAANGGAASFDFLLPQLEAGKYFAHVVLDHRLVTGDIDRTNNEIVFGFEVTEHVDTYALELVDAVATGRASGDVVELVDGAEIESEVSDVVVSFKNVSGKEIDAPYVYGGVKLQDSKGNYILGSADGWYERLSYEGLGADETGTFKFTMKALEAGDYTLTLAIDQRAAIGDVGDFRTINFTVKGEEAAKADLVNTGISAVDKVSGAALDLNAVLPTQIPVFTVTFANKGAAITAPYFYSSVQVVKSDGTVVLDTYERLCKTGLGAGEAGSFSFTIGKQAVGSYTVKVQLDNREAIDQASRDNDYVEYAFEVVNLEGAALPELFGDEAFADELFVEF
ncbi:MAG: hypothetical protein IKE69_05265 [Thermoguttaceae bacterium]|nr:hypothetical protein [Thermoguttaceae bacterium]